MEEGDALTQQHQAQAQAVAEWRSRLVSLFGPIHDETVLEGGLGHNIPIDAFSYAPSIQTLKPQIDGSYLFMAGARLGDSAGGFVYTFDGNLTVKATGPDAGFRINIQAWLLTADHSGQGQFQGFIQYAGSSFDAGLWGEYHLLGDAVWVKAPQNACSVHFGNGIDVVSWRE